MSMEDIERERRAGAYASRLMLMHLSYINNGVGDDGNAYRRVIAEVEDQPDADILWRLIAGVLCDIACGVLGAEMSIEDAVKVVEGWVAEDLDELDRL